ncbi:EF-hand calcium-binding domain-containing protein 6 isoform X1 [Parasteatoda tepidariorum]|uniref:EF-hand calcium-binding domain-containing protein 6 isoform X1 n=1 Tax=Parasteatoda tepidariorum TaxID=114398 RepID=UPI001C728C2E|nr:EF-hand calcium-binding domain-containing protein 6 isoform X1 [Parasteatoda tepidariorum]
MDCCCQQPIYSSREDDKISEENVCSSQLEAEVACCSTDEENCCNRPAFTSQIEETYCDAVDEEDCHKSAVQSQIEATCCNATDGNCHNRSAVQSQVEPECECHEEEDGKPIPSPCEIEPKCVCHEEDKSSLNRSLSPALSKIASSASLSSIASFPEYDLKPNMPVSQIKERLIELIDLRGSDIVQACRNFDRRATRKIQKTHLRQVLRTFCFPITAAQFDALLNEHNLYQSGKINYMDFFSNLTNGKSITYEKSTERLDNLPIDEVELRIKEKIMPILRDVIRSFWLFDVNKDGMVQKSELRRIIKNYCFDLSEHLFNELWKVHDPKCKGTISYKDFLIKLGINADRYRTFMPSETVAQALCWSDKQSKNLTQDLNFDRRTRRFALENKDDPAIMGLPLEEIVSEFLKRLYYKSKLLKRIFNVFDYEKNGIIALSDFIGAINFFLMPLSPPMFHQVMKRIGICLCPDSKIDYKCFLEKCSQSGTKGFKATKLDCLPVVQHIKNHVLNPNERLHSLLTIKNSGLREQITRKELRRTLKTGLKLHLSDEEFKDLLEVLDPGNTNIIQCKSFLKLFEHPEEDCACVEKESSSSIKFSPDEEKYLCLKGNKLKSKFKHHFNKVFKDVEKAIFICDPNQSGFITTEKLKNILNGLCIPLTYEQYEEIFSGFRVYGDSLNYREFLNVFYKKPGEDAKKWTAKVNKLATYKSRCPPELPLDEAEEMLRECVQSRKSAMLRDFKTLDVCNVGVICKDDVRNVFSKFSFRFNDKQFCELWKKLPRNKFDQLLYDKFLEEYSISEFQPDADDKSVAGDFGKSGVVHVTFNENMMKKRETVNRKSAKDILFSEAPHLKKIIVAIEPVIIRNIRTIRYHLNRADPKLSGVVDFSVLTGILDKSGVRFSPEEEFFILEYFDKSLGGKINYREFLQIFVWYA